MHRTRSLNFIFLSFQSVPKPPPLPPTKKRKRVMEEPPLVPAPKRLLSGVVPLENFLTTLQKVCIISSSVGISQFILEEVDPHWQNFWFGFHLCFNSK